MRLCSASRPLAVLLATALGASCTPVVYGENWMDHPSTQDPAHTDTTYLVSTRIPRPSERDLDTPVVLAAHGFGASTWEWFDFAEYAEARGVYVSNVLLGGHGLSTDAWLQTDWADWGEPIRAEYAALVDKGYRHISIATSSTGGTLALQHIALGNIGARQPPENLLMVAPLVVTYNKLLYQARIVGPVLNNVPSGGNDAEKELFYFNRPHPLFYELLDLITQTERDLKEGGISLPEGTRVKAWQGEREETVDVISLDLIADGLVPTRGGSVETEVVDTEHHIFTREIARDDWNDERETLQTRVFDEMLDRVFESAAPPAD